MFIRACDEVVKEVLPIEEAREKGALAFFAEKYGDVVRVVSIGNYSTEFCGGTHLSSTGQIGTFKIVSENAIAQGIRRFEAVTGIGALDQIKETEAILESIAKTLKSPINETKIRVNSQMKRIKDLEKELEKFRFDAVKNSIDQILDNASDLNGSKIITHSFDGLDMNILRKVCDLIKQKSKSSIIVLGAKSQDNASILIAITDDLVKKGFKANDIIKEVAPLINGSGGGKPQLAQAGSKEVDKVDNAITQANRIIKEKIKL